jgi:predicted nucleic acid-binding protein
LRAVLDAWALVAFLAGQEPAAARVETLLEEGGGAVCSINLGEVLYLRIREGGDVPARDGMNILRRSLAVVDADWELIEAAARVKARGGISFPDAFCIATALRLRAPLWTGDPEIVDSPAGHEVVDLR